MKRCLVPLLAACLLLSACSGLPAAREMGDMALLRTMGVDVSPAGVAVTVSTGPRAKGLQAEGEPSLALAVDRPSLSGACLAMQGQSDSYVFFGYVDQLLLGEELAREGIQSVLDYFARDVELGLGAQLWLVRGSTARQAVSSGGDEGIDSRLETLQTDGGMGIAAISRTAGQVYTDLLEQGAAFAPALVLTGAEESVLAEQGYGVLKGEALVGFLDGEAAKGLELLAGGPRDDILELILPEGEVSVEIVSARTRSRLVFQGDVPSALALTCQIKARLAEYGDPLGSRGLEALRTALEVRERGRLETALSQLRAWRADCTGLGARAAMAHPARWQEIREVWPELFAQIQVEIAVDIDLEG